jgi:ATP-binding cassette subfamily B protein
MDSTFTIAEKAPKLPRTPWRFALHFYKQARFAVFSIFFFETLQASCTITLPYAVKKIIDAVTLANETGVDVFEAAKDPLIFFAWLNLGIVIFSRSSGAIVVSNGPIMRGMIRKSIFKYIQFHSHRYFVAHFAGSLANRISEVSTSCMHGLWTIAFTFYPLIIQSIVALIILFSASEKLALVLLVWLVIYTSISIFLARKAQVYSKDFAAARSKVSGKIVDSVTNMMNTKMFARGDYEGDYLTDYIDYEIIHAKRTFWFMEKMRWFQFISAMILMISMVAYALKIWSEDGMTVGEFSMVAGIAIMLIEAARGLSRSFLEFFEYIGNIADAE